MRWVLGNIAIMAMFVLPSAASGYELNAIVVGNASYASQPLDTPIADADVIGQTLEELGFSVDLYHDVTTAQFPQLLEHIGGRMGAADVSVFYFAGHGLHYQGENLLLPVDTDLSDSQSILANAVRLSDLLEAVTTQGSGLKIVILDACRNEVTGEGGLQSGFTLVEAPQGELVIAFSTAAGNVAYDSVGGGNSPYAAALTNALLQANSDVYDVFRSVRRAVRSSTGGRQIPWIAGSVEREFIFREGEALPARETREVDAAVVTTFEGTPVTVDDVLWYYLQNSIDPQDFVQFASVFPDSPHSLEAQERKEFLLVQLEQKRATRGDGVGLSPEAVVSEIEPSIPVAADDETGRTSILLDQSGSYVMRDTFRIWPLELPESGPLGLAAHATACDEEAADPVDPQKLSPGLSEATVNLRRALRACAYDLAREPENPRLLFQFGRVLEIANRSEWANAYYARAAELGYSAAMVNLGYNFRVGRGVERNPQRALDLTIQAANLGNLRARTNVGTAFQTGTGVEADPEEGILWLRLAASLGWPHAANALGDAYRTGLGVEQDLTEAFALYLSAAGQGQTTAMANLGRAYLDGAGTERDLEAGLEWLEQAIALGNGFAPVYLGQFYLQGGVGIPAQPARAAELFAMATDRGNAQGYRELARGYLEGSFPGGVDPALAYRNALFAQAGQVRGADELAATAAALLSESERAEIEADVNDFISQNGL